MFTHFSIHIFRVTFPQMLNLDSFVNNSEMNFVQQQQKNKQINGGDTVSLGHESIESAVRSDDCSTTDSGSAMEEDNCSATNFATNTNMNETYSQVIFNFIVESIFCIERLTFYCRMMMKVLI